MLGLLNRLSLIRKLPRKQCASRVDSTDEPCSNNAWWPSRYCGRHQGKTSWVLRLFGAGLVALTTYFAREIKEHFFPSKQTKASQNVEAKISKVADEQSQIRRDQEALLNLARGNSIDRGSRTEIFALERRVNAASNDVVDLQAWKADRDMRRMSESLKAEKAKELGEERRRAVAKPAWDASVPVYRLAVERLESILRDLARQKGQREWSTFRGIPLTPTFSGEFGELGLGTNKNWHVKITTDEGPSLWIKSGNGLQLKIAVNPQEVIVTLRDNTEKVLFNETSARSAFRQTVEEAVRDFILEISERENSIQK